MYNARMNTPDELTLDDLIRLRTLGPGGYLAAALALFTSGRATPAHWEAMSEALLHVSESSAAAIVLVIDHAIIDYLKAEQEQRLAEAFAAYLTPEEPEEATGEPA